MNIETKFSVLENLPFNANTSFKTKKIKQGHWAQLITLDGKYSSSNSVVRSVLQDDWQNVVDATISFYESLNVPYRWIVTPATRPQELPDYLQKKGMSLSYAASGMVLHSSRARFSHNPEIQVRQIPKEEFEIYASAFASCWEIPEQKQAMHRQSVLNSLTNTTNPYLIFVAYMNDHAVGVGALILLQEGAYLVEGAVNKNFRGRGVYKALLSARAQYAAEQGHEYLYTFAIKETSAPICIKLGFEPVFDQLVFTKEK